MCSSIREYEFSVYHVSATSRKLDREIFYEKKYKQIIMFNSKIVYILFQNELNFEDFDGNILTYILQQDLETKKLRLPFSSFLGKRSINKIMLTFDSGLLYLSQKICSFNYMQYYKTPLQNVNDKPLIIIQIPMANTEEMGKVDQISKMAIQIRLYQLQFMKFFTIQIDPFKRYEQMRIYDSKKFTQIHSFKKQITQNMDDEISILQLFEFKPKVYYIKCGSKSDMKICCSLKKGSNKKDYACQSFIWDIENDPEPKKITDLPEDHFHFVQILGYFTKYPQWGIEMYLKAMSSQRKFQKLPNSNNFCFLPTYFIDPNDYSIQLVEKIKVTKIQGKFVLDETSDYLNQHQSLACQIDDKNQIAIQHKGVSVYAFGIPLTAVFFLNSDFFYRSYKNGMRIYQMNSQLQLNVAQQN